MLEEGTYVVLETISKESVLETLAEGSRRLEVD